MPSLVDTHAHLDFPEFAPDLDAVLRRAHERGVIQIVSVGFDLSSSRAAVRLAGLHEGVYPAIGIHPNESSAFTPQIRQELLSLATLAPVVAIGETGLDYYRQRSPRDCQLRSFLAHLDLAAELDLPVIVHSREAQVETLDVLRDWAGTVTPTRRQSGRELGVVHCFSGSVAQALECVALGFAVSIAGPVTFPNAGLLREVARRVPLSSLLVETDAPFLAPQQWRGKRNEPAYVHAVAAAIAAERGVPLDLVAEATTQNARRIFGLA